MRTTSRRERGSRTRCSTRDEVVGCVYVYPAPTDEHDAEVRSWVRASRAELDAPLRQTVAAWLARDWPFERPLYAPLLG